jgi:hypothetical protein
MIGNNPPLQNIYIHRSYGGTILRISSAVKNTVQVSAHVNWQRIRHM